MLLHGVAKIRFLRASYDFGPLGVNVEGVAEPWGEKDSVSQGAEMVGENTFVLWSETEQVTPRGCAVSTHGDTQIPTGHSPGQSAPGDPA